MRDLLFSRGINAKMLVSVDGRYQHFYGLVFVEQLALHAGCFAE